MALLEDVLLPLLQLLSPSSAEARVWPLDQPSRDVIEATMKDPERKGILEAAQRDPRDVFIQSLLTKDPTLAGSYGKDRGTGENRIKLYQKNPGILSHELLHFLLRGPNAPKTPESIQEPVAFTGESGLSRRRPEFEQLLMQLLGVKTLPPRQKYFWEK